MPAPLALFALVACSPGLPEPVLDSVSPSRGWTGEVTRVSLRGEHLLPTISVGAVSPVASDFEAWLLSSPEVRLEGVQLVDYGEIGALVPAGIEPGLYDVELRTPAGDVATLPEGFTVTKTRADHLALVAQSAAYDLGESASITVELRDPDDALVADALAVEVSAASPEDAAGVEFFDGTLADQAASETGVGVRGKLAPDGTGQVVLASTLPDDVTLTVRAIDDEAVTSGDLLLSWNAGSLADVEFDFPFAPFVAEAGVPFEVSLALFDVYGNPLDHTPARVLLTDDCADLRDTVDVYGPTVVSITLDTACPVDRLHALNQSVDVESEPFEVVAGDAAGFALTAAPVSVTAGQDPVLVLIESVDAWENPVETYTGPVVLSDSAGGLDPERVNCPDLASGVALCTVYLLSAGEVSLNAEDADGRRGESNTVTVAADVPASVLVDVLALSVEAGAPFGIIVEVIDAWGNAIEIEPSGADRPSFEDDSGTISCAWTGPVDGARQAFSCTATAATLADQVVVRVPSLSVSGVAADTLDIVNAALAEVEFTVPTSVTAGQLFPFGAAGYDSYGNAYLVQSDPTVDLSDSTGTIDTTSVTLDTLGLAVSTATITRAHDSVRLSASQGGRELGSSPSFEVTAGTLAGFAVDAPPWVAVGDGADVEITAIDAFSNTVTTYGGVLDVTPSAGCDAASTSEFGSGVAELTLDCDSAALGVVVHVEDAGGNDGESLPMEVVDFDCAGGPTADLLVEGEEEPVVCLAGGSFTADVEAGGSSAGAGSITLFHVVDSDGNHSRTSSDTTTLDWSGAGAREVRLLVADSDGCADETSTWAWVGEDDGSPTGPVAVTLSDSTAVAGSSLTVSLSAVDCTGDVAAGQDLLVRADLGEPAGSSTGSGLAVTLDGSGETSVSWDFTTGYIGTASIFAGTASTSAYGTDSAEVTQDGERPHVVRVSPSGVQTGTVDEITVIFDEPVLSSTVGSVSLSGPSSSVGLTSSVSGSTLTLTPKATVDADLGAWTLTIPQNVRDEAGNRLDGEWTGSPADFTVVFGNVADLLPVAAGCGVDREAFTPDGDDGTDAEGDSVTFTPVVSGTAAWWWLTVEDAAGDQIRSDRADGASVSIAWDGRADDGILAEPADYTAVVRAIDDNGNVGDVCTQIVSLDQHVALP